MKHEEKYRGYQITVDTSKCGDGYEWTYQINGLGSALRHSKDHPLESEETMLQEGILYAKDEIDRM